MSIAQARNKASASSGQAIFEYLLIGAIVAVAGFALWISVAGGLQSMFANLKGDMGKNIASSSSAQSFAVNSGAMNANDSGTVTLLNGMTLNPDNVSGNAQASVETLGANGTTEQLAMEQGIMANQLVAEGKITKKQAITLHDLSNAGHTLATGMAAIESAADTAANVAPTLTGKIKTFAEQKRTFKNRQQTVRDIAAQISQRAAIDPTQGGVVTTTSLQTFSTLLQKVKTDPTLPPEVKTVVVDIGTDIQALAIETGTQAKQVTATATNLTGETSKGTVTSATTVDDLSTSTDSTTVINNAVHICVAGSWQDSGTTCTP